MSKHYYYYRILVHFRSNVKVINFYLSEMVRVSVSCTDTDRYHRHFAVYDYECMLVSENQDPM